MMMVQLLRAPTAGRILGMTTHQQSTLSLQHRHCLWHRPVPTIAAVPSSSLPQCRSFSRTRSGPKVRVLRRTKPEKEALLQETQRQATDLLGSLLPKVPRMHYCTKQHLWMRAVPENTYEYRIEVGMTPRALESVGDILSIELNGIVKDGSAVKTKSKSIFYQEADLFLAVKWEGIEHRDTQFFLVTGTNVWRCPIRGTARLNEQHVERNWKVNPPDVHTVLCFVHCSREDYYAKLLQQDDPPPPIEEEDSNKPKENPNRSRNTNDPLERYKHRWVTNEEYEKYMKDFDP